METKEIIPTCHQTLTSGKNKLNEAQNVTNNATPSAYATYIAP